MASLIFGSFYKKAFSNSGVSQDATFVIDLLSPAEIAKLNASVDPVIVGGVVTGIFLIAIIVIIILLCAKYNTEKRRHGEKQEFISTYGT